MGWGSGEEPGEKGLAPTDKGQEPERKGKGAR